MRTGRTHKIILMQGLLLAIASCTRVQVPGNLDRSVKDNQATASDKLGAQSVQPPKNHLVRSRFEPGPSDGELTFIFEVGPAPQTLPIVRWLGATPHDDATMLVVRTDPTGRFSATLPNVPPVVEGRLLIELSDPGTRSDLHSADFALLKHIADGPSSRPSRDGHFVVFTKPEGVSPELRLLIGSVEQPIESLPRGVTERNVVGTYSVDFLPASAGVDGWQLTMALGQNDANPVLFYLPKGRAEWRVLVSTAIREHPLLGAAFAGPGTYMLVREVTR
jgi:hypothetical protein